MVSVFLNVSFEYHDKLKALNRRFQSVGSSNGGLYGRDSFVLNMINCWKQDDNEDIYVQ